VCAGSLTVARVQLVLGRRSTLTVRVRDAQGQPLGGVRVTLRGAGVNVARVTDAGGRARFKIRPASMGVLRVSVAQSSGCASVTRTFRVFGPFRPPKPNFTG
jgi:hypothetical protein